MYSKPKKSLAELQEEVRKLKEAREAVKSYNELQNEKSKIQREIRSEGFKVRHKKALGIINGGLGIGRSIGTGIKSASKSSAPYIKSAYKEYKKYKKKRG